MASQRSQTRVGSSRAAQNTRQRWPIIESPGSRLIMRKPHTGLQIAPGEKWPQALWSDMTAPPGLDGAPSRSCHVDRKVIVTYSPSTRPLETRASWVAPTTRGYEMPRERAEPVMGAATVGCDRTLQPLNAEPSDPAARARLVTERPTCFPPWSHRSGLPPEAACTRWGSPGDAVLREWSDTLRSCQGSTRA